MKGIPMLVLENRRALEDMAGKTVGPSAWFEVTQSIIDRFADLTDDSQWIHVDTERAAREMPGGKTIAHGYFVLSLLAKFVSQLYHFQGSARALNYGSDRLRFLNPVPAGSRVRAAITFKRVTAIPSGLRCEYEATLEIEGQSKPALTSESIVLYL
jgi:acyl dehydratase